VNGVPNEDPVWKDTALVPAGGTVDVLVEMSNPGRWMVHCHIAEHLQAGMMMAFDVEDAP
jgi:FtsP/CotA-like multicopper oxidase with cupredoxin domain